MKAKLTGSLVPCSRRGAPGALVAVLGCTLFGSTWLSPAWGQDVVRTVLPDAPSTLLSNVTEEQPAQGTSSSSSTSELPASETPAQGTDSGLQPRAADSGKAGQGPVLDENGKPIRPQTGRIFGICPNFVSVSGGTRPKPAGWKTDFRIANRQAYDYSSFGFLLISSSLAYAQTSHPSLNTVNGGNAILWAYVWRWFLDKTDGSYQGSFFFPALLHEDTRYFALGTGSPKKRLLHAALSVVVAHNYEQRPTFNAAGLLGKAGAQAVSKTYYPAGSEGFGVLAEKFSYSCLRQAIFAIIREYSPDAQARVRFTQKVDH